ncbi:MAG: heparan-alpha-glucosaminide N-acetyltransferase [Candidatus Micrarchaeia archaeon]
MPRFWEVDFARGAAVASMLAFNWLYALAYFGIASFDPALPANQLWAFATVAAFVFLAGLSTHLASTQGKRLAARGAKIFACGLLVTATTFYFIPEAFVVFGVLHLIGASIILAGAFALRLPPVALVVLGCVIIALAVPLATIQPETQLFLWLGVAPAGFSSVDYEPLFPWFGVFLFGVAAGKIFYRGGRRAFALFEKPFYAGALCLAGRHSLAIYLAHQPLLVAALCALGAARL